MYDPDEGVIASRQERWAGLGAPLPVFPSVEAVLESDAEAVVVEGHVYQNLDYAEAALRAGKHVLLEKPAGVDLAHFSRLQDLAGQGACSCTWPTCGATTPPSASSCAWPRPAPSGRSTSSGATSPSRWAGIRSWPRSSPSTTAASTSRWPGTSST